MGSDKLVATKHGKVWMQCTVWDKCVAVRTKNESIFHERIEASDDLVRKFLIPNTLLTLNCSTVSLKLLIPSFPTTIADLHSNFNPHHSRLLCHWQQTKAESPLPIISYRHFTVQTFLCVSNPNAATGRR